MGQARIGRIAHGRFSRGDRCGRYAPCRRKVLGLLGPAIPLRSISRIRTAHADPSDRRAPVHPFVALCLKEHILNRSLSVILPVHNAQSWLSESVNEILEVIAELTDRFELIILDDGSTDGTWEVGRELARRYPQVRPLRQAVRCGGSLAIQPGLREAQGDVVMAHCGEAAVDTGEIVRLWRSLEPSAPVPPAPKLMRSAMAIRRPTFNTTASSGRIIGSSASQLPRPTNGFRLLRSGAAGDVRRTISAFQEAARGRRLPQPSPVGATKNADGQARRPNFLSHTGSRLADRANGE